MQAHVVYATITGNNEEVADIVVAAFEAANIAVKKTEISQTEVDEFEDVDIAVVVPYTYDQGSLPDEGLDFFEDLADATLDHVVYGVFFSQQWYKPPKHLRFLLIRRQACLTFHDLHPKFQPDFAQSL